MKHMKRGTKDKVAGLLFVLPWIIGFLAFTLIPFGQTIKFSMSKVQFLARGIATSSVGIKNFTDVLMVNPDFKLQIPVFLKDMFFFVPMVLVFSIILSVLLNTKIRGRRALRAIYFLPVILMSGPVITNLVNMQATTLKGAPSFFVYQFIAKYFPGVLSVPILYIFDNVVLFLWFSGVPILIFLSGLQKTDQSVYEAARVDGASAWQQFWKITMANLKPFIFLNAIYIIVEVSNSALNPFIALIKKSMFDGKQGFGFAAAATWIYFGMILLAVLAAYLLLGRVEKEPKASTKGRRRKHEKIRAKA